MRREIVAFGSYYKDFMATLHDYERRKVLYVLSLFMANSFQKKQVCGIDSTDQCSTDNINAYL